MPPSAGQGDGHGKCASRAHVGDGDDVPDRIDPDDRDELRESSDHDQRNWKVQKQWMQSTNERHHSLSDLRNSGFIPGAADDVRTSVLAWNS